jgi:ABC-type glutathione transport system ATPase component
MPVEGDSMAVLLEVKNLKTQFNTESGLVRAVDGVSYHTLTNGRLLVLWGKAVVVNQSANCR